MYVAIGFYTCREKEGVRVGGKGVEWKGKEREEERGGVKG